MTDIKNKLGMYARKPASGSPQTDATPPATEAGDLLFGETRLRPLSAGAFVRRVDPEQVSFGTKTLHGYQPLELTGILELALVPREEVIYPSEVLFLDTETTGLSRGVGNYPFLIGLAYFEQERLRLEQLYLNEMQGEEAVLNRLGELMRRFPYLVSYNGKSFDLPLIRNRLILNRKKRPVPIIHFDLLHILKRLYPKGSMAAYRQANFEQHLLGMKRTGDLPGAEIPQVYFDYCKYGEDRGMDRIFEHNLLDLKGMVFLFLEAIRMYRDRDSSSPGVHSGLGRVLARNRRIEEAIELLDVALQTRQSENANPDRRRLDLLFLGGLYRSRGDWVRAADVYEQTAAEHRCPLAMLSLAKLREHRIRDLTAALQQVALLEQVCAELPERPRNHQFSVGALAHRRARITAKLQRRATAAP